MRTKWLVGLLGLSLAVNVTFGVALWVSWHGARAAETALGAAYANPLCPEEKKVREELATSLCARTPDRAAIEDGLARLDAVRAGQRRAILDRWLTRCADAPGSQRAALDNTVKRFLCPWQGAKGGACCAPSPTPGARAHNPKQHGQS